MKSLSHLILLLFFDFFFQFDTEHSIIYIYIKLLNFDAAFPISKKKRMGFFFSSVLLKLYKTLATHKLLPMKNIIKHNIITYRNS